MRVCVIGAGPSGLTTIKQLLDEGHDVTCFEKADDIGGIWYRKADGSDADEMKVYDDLVLTISMKLMSFSDFMTEGDRVFADHAGYLKYLRAYVEKFGLRKHITFDAPVSRVRQEADGSWKVTVKSGDARTEHAFEAVAVCMGPFQKPNESVKDLDKFTGEILHSYRYRNAAQARGKRVLVIGLSESGADVLTQVSNVASACTLAIHSYTFILPRLFEGRWATDAATVRAHHYECAVRASNNKTLPFKTIFGDTGPTRWLFKTCAAAYGLGHVAKNVASDLLRGRSNRADDRAPPSTNLLGEPLYPLKLDVGTEWTQAHMDAINEWNRRSHKNRGSWCQRTIFCKNVTFIPNIVNGKIKLNDSGIERIEGKRVFFKNGESQEYDTIALCIGFQKDFSIFEPDIKVADNNVRNLYKHCFHPDYDGRLAFIGFLRPLTGGIPACSEMQARYFALLCSNKIKLPSNVRELIEKEKAWETAASGLSKRATEAIPSQAFFMDSIASEIGCFVTMSDLIRDPRLLVRLWFYPFNQACYRLRGPHSNYEEAFKELMSDPPGPWTQNAVVLMLAALSFMPASVRPRDLTFKGPEDAPYKPGADDAEAPWYLRLVESLVPYVSVIPASPSKREVGRAWGASRAPAERERQPQHAAAE